MTTELNIQRFQPGETLVVRPGDSDDPEAQSLAGRHCRFLRYVTVTGHCQVEFRGGKTLYFRPTDLARAEAQS